MKSNVIGIIVLMLLTTLTHSQNRRFRNNGNQRSYSHKSAFSVILIGTAGPRSSKQRSCPAALIQYNGSYCLVDMGNGTQSRLKQLGISSGKIETFMFTHHHLDHNEEYIPLTINSWLRGRSKLNLIGPPGTRQLHQFVTTFYREDMAYRKGRRGQDWNWNGMIKQVDIKEVNGDQTIQFPGLKINTTKVPHSTHTQAYRFDSNEKSIVISGDLSYSENLVKLAKNADILVIDGQAITERQRRRPSRNKSSGMQRRRQQGSTRPHATLQEVATMAAKAGVKKLVLTHLSSGKIDESATIAAYRKIFKGEIVIGRDLLEVY